MIRMKKAPLAPGRPGSYLFAECPDRATMLRVLLELERRDLGRSDVSILVRDAGSVYESRSAPRAEPSMSTVRGSALGTVGGAGLFGLTAVTGLGFTGMGMIGVGPLVVTATMLASGGVFGGLVGALVGAGIPKAASRQNAVDPVGGECGIVAVRIEPSQLVRAMLAVAAAGVDDSRVRVIDQPPVLGDRTVAVDPADPSMRGSRLP